MIKIPPFYNFFQAASDNQSFCLPIIILLFFKNRILPLNPPNVPSDSIKRFLMETLIYS